MARCEVSVKSAAISVTGVSLSQTTTSMKVGQELLLVATVTPETATDKSVSWSSSDSNIASVTDEGKVTALKKGKATITVTTVDGGKSAQCEVVVGAELAAITGEASHISCSNARIAGQVVLPETTSKDLEFGVLYSETSGVLFGNAAVVKATKYDSDCKYDVSIGILNAATKYYYRSYLTQDGSVTYGEVLSFETLPVSSMIKTEAASLINPKDATLNAILDLTDCEYTSIEYGFELTGEGGSTTTIKAANLSSGKYSVVADGLAYEKNYSYAAYVSLDGRKYSAEPVQFRTAAIAAGVSLNPASEIGYTDATLSGALLVTSPGTYSKSMKLYYSSSVNTLADLKSSGTAVSVSLSSDDAFSKKISGLSSSTTYYYVAVALVDGVEFASEVKSFKTLALVGLSKNGTANCYIVTGAGNYSFNAVKGNTFDSVGAVASAEVLWESFGTSIAPSKGVPGVLVSNVSYSGGEIRFSASDRKGNAVIAAKDASGNILWSWHIWLTVKPVDEVYNNNAGTMMDRNLGATSAIPGDVKALGLLYQWGRKDPFLGSSSISGSTMAVSTISWPSSVSSNSSNGTLAYATAHPTTFITYNSSNYDWYYTGSSSTDNTRWQTSDKTKGLYDPCPAGYRVPDGGSNGVWSKAFGTSSYWLTSSNWDSADRGMNFGKTDKKLGSASIIWYPASGCLMRSGGSLEEVGNFGYYWSCTPNGNNAYSWYFSSYGYVYPSSSNNRAYGLSVRCLKE